MTLLQVNVIVVFLLKLITDNSLLNGRLCLKIAIIVVPKGCKWSYRHVLNNINKSVFSAQQCDQTF